MFYVLVSGRPFWFSNEKKIDDDGNEIPLFHFTAKDPGPTYHNNHPELDAAVAQGVLVRADTEQEAIQIKDKKIPKKTAKPQRNVKVKLIEEGKYRRKELSEYMHIEMEANGLTGGEIDGFEEVTE